VLFYESADDVASKAPFHFEAHRAASGSSTPEASAADPFVLGGVVQSSSV
jgi:hypothetical protein